MSVQRIRGTTTLYADDGAWTGAGLTLTRRWQRRGDGLWGAIASVGQPGYPPIFDDIGRRVRARVRATNAEGSTDAHSAAAPPVMATGAQPTSPPTPAA